MTVPTVSPRGFRAVALAAVAALVLTIVSGAAVRLTGSGLGCPTWPSCTRTSVVAPASGHAWIEFANRLVNALVTVASIGALAAARRRRPRRRDLTGLSMALVAGLIGEIAMGGLVVVTDLDPVVVSLHFLFGLVFLGVAVVLHHRAGLPDDDAPRAGVGVRPGQLWLSRAVTANLAVVVALGTVVTSTGPHGGDPKAPRFHYSLHAVAQMHGTSVEVLLVLTLALMASLAHTAAAAPVLRRAQVLVAAMAAQAGVGYTQYFTHDPVGIVAVHVAGSALVVIAALRFYLGLRSPAPVPEPAPVRAAPAPVA